KVDQSAAQAEPVVLRGAGGDIAGEGEMIDGQRAGLVEDARPGPVGEPPTDRQPRDVEVGPGVVRDTERRGPGAAKGAAVAVERAEVAAGGPEVGHGSRPPTSPGAESR